MKHIAIFLSLLLYGCSSSLPEKCEEKNPVLTDGKKNGDDWKCHENGVWESAGKWKDGKEEGTWTHWHNNREKRLEGNYKNGNKEGKWTWWSEVGQVARVSKYKDGEEIKGKGQSKDPYLKGLDKYR